MKKKLLSLVLTGALAHAVSAADMSGTGGGSGGNFVIDDSLYLHTTGDETANGSKNFLDAPMVPPYAFAPGAIDHGDIPLASVSHGTCDGTSTTGTCTVYLTPGRSYTGAVAGPRTWIFGTFGSPNAPDISASDSATVVKAVVTNGPFNCTVPASYRGQSVSPSATFRFDSTNGFHEFSFAKSQDGNLYLMDDMVDAIPPGSVMGNPGNTDKEPVPVSIAGTVNQVGIARSGNTLTFSLPQDVDVNGDPIFRHINAFDYGGTDVSVSFTIGQQYHGAPYLNFIQFVEGNYFSVVNAAGGEISYNTSLVTDGITRYEQNKTGIYALVGDPIGTGSHSAAYTTVLEDQGTILLHPTSDDNARTFTIDSNANAPYPLGTVLTVINKKNNLTVAITSDTLTHAGTANTGSIVIAVNGMATFVKTETTGWLVNGVGFTP